MFLTPWSWKLLASGSSTSAGAGGSHWVSEPDQQHAHSSVDDFLARLVHFQATLGLEPQKVEKYQIWIVCNSSQFLHHLLFSSTVLLEWSYSTAYLLCAPHDFHFCVLLLGWVGLKHFNLLKFIKNKKLPLFREAYIQGLTWFQ